VRPLCPTPRPAELHIRLRFATPATPDEVLALLPRLAERIARRLQLEGRACRSLRLVVGWERGRVAWSRAHLRDFTDSPVRLDTKLRRLLLPLLAPCGSRPLRTPHVTVPYAERTTDGLGIRDEDRDGMGDEKRNGIEELRVALGDLAPAMPAQATFWRTPHQHMHALDEIAATLHGRHGHPLLLFPRVVRPDAVFCEDRYAWSDLRTGISHHAPPGTGHSSEPDGPSRLRRADTAGAAAEATDAWAGWQEVPQRLHWW
jgi:hypothetical protein